MMKKRANKSGFRGVYRNNNGQWQAQIYGAGAKHMLGSFDTKEQAAERYDDAAHHFHGNRAVLNFSKRKPLPFASASDISTRSQNVTADQPVQVAVEKPAEMPVTQPQPAPTAVPEPARAIPAGCCPRCASPLYGPCGGDSKRCRQCGFQSEEIIPTGLSRAQLADEEWCRRHIQKGMVMV